MKTYWNWKYYLIFMVFSSVIYFLVLWKSPNFERAKNFYLWQALTLSFPWIFLLFFGQWVAFIVIPSDYLEKYLLIFIPVFIYSPILFNKKMKKMKRMMFTHSVIGNLVFKPVWDDKKYLADRYNPRHNRWIGKVTVNILTFVAPWFLVLFGGLQFYPFNMFVLGAVNALIILGVIEATYRSIIVHYYLAELEKYLEMPIRLEKFPTKN